MTDVLLSQGFKFKLSNVYNAVMVYVLSHLVVSSCTLQGFSFFKNK